MPVNKLTPVHSYDIQTSFFNLNSTVKPMTDGIEWWQPAWELKIQEKIRSFRQTLHWEIEVDLLIQIW